jgi:MinD superfamily P-loop ATPase
VRLLDCDVEEPNDHLFVGDNFAVSEDVLVPKPVWDADPCTGCGKCAEVCNYNAIAVIKGKVLIFNELCHSCGACSFTCPVDALPEKQFVIGRVDSASEMGPFYFGRGVLNIGEALAPNVVQALKKHMDDEAVNILDSAPGTACPVVKALEGADVAVLLTEPTPFGLNDLKLAVSMTLQMGIPTGIVVNRSDGVDRIIADWADMVGVPIVGRIPFERKYAETYSGGGILVEEHAELRENLLGIYGELEGLRGSEVAPAPRLDEYVVVSGGGDSRKAGGADDYREITVISGKGGTGKTTVTGSFAVLADAMRGGDALYVLADNDVDAADLHLLLKPRILEEHPFVGSTKARVNAAECIGCGKCAEVCHFDAIRLDGPGNDLIGKTWQVDAMACEGCGLCPMVCPVDAIASEQCVTGHWYLSETEYGPMTHARLGIAEENSGRLVTQVRNRAADLASELAADGILGDGPPGTGCPVIAAVTGADLVLVVTEPTVAGVHDMERVLQLAAHFGVPALVIINKSDLNAGQSERIEEIALSMQSRVVGRIPFDRVVNDALMAGSTVVQYNGGGSRAAEAIRAAWQSVQNELAELK